MTPEEKAAFRALRKTVLWDHAIKLHLLTKAQRGDERWKRIAEVVVGKNITDIEALKAEISDLTDDEIDELRGAGDPGALEPGAL